MKKPPRVITIAVGWVKGPPALGRRVKAELRIRPDKLGPLAYRAENSVKGRTRISHGAIELVLESPNPMAMEGRLGNVVWEYGE